MTRTHRISWQAALVLVALAGVAVCRQTGDQAADGAASGDRDAAGADTTPYAAEVPEGPGAAVAVLVDNSGSMSDAAPGDARSKDSLAREALEQVLGATRDRLRADPAYPIQVGIYRFSSDVEQVLPIAPYDSAAVERALAAIPPPDGGTAIGDAMRRARRDLYRSGAFRKYLLVITDGESNTGADPERVAAEIARRSEGAVRMYYVAFDVDPERFAFVRRAGGDVLPAAGGGQLRQTLATVYEGKILAEAADPGGMPPRAARGDTSDTERSEP